MQQKINYLIWGLVIFLIIGFGILAFINKDKIKEFKYTNTKPYNIDIRVYSKNAKQGNISLNNLKNIEIVKDSQSYLNNIFKNLSQNKKNDKYLIQVDDDVLVGKHYNQDKYKVALYYQDNTLFKIIDVENEFILTEDYNSTEYDRIIMVGSLDCVNKLDNFFKKNKLLKEQKQYVEDINNITIYWLKDNELVTSLNG